MAASFGPNRDARKAYEVRLGQETQQAGDALATGQAFAATVHRGQVLLLVLLVVSLVVASGRRWSSATASSPRCGRSPTSSPGSPAAT